MKKSSILGLLFMSVFFFGIVHAHAAGVVCPVLVSNVSLGSHGADVSALQRFLISQNLLPAGSATGYFGKLTQSAVQSWQSAQGIVSSGAPLTTGFGAVGMKTRLAIGSACTKKSDGNLPVPYQNCTFQDLVITDGASIVTYQAPIVPNGQSCVAQTRTCSYGTLSGSYAYKTCSVTPPVCVALPPETHTTACPPGAGKPGGMVTVTRTSSCPGPAWSDWVTTTNTCQANYQPATPSATLSEFWSGEAAFQFIRKQVFPTADVPRTDWIGANTQQDIVVRGSTWYRFSREQTDSGLRTVIHKSDDKGLTWTGRTELVSPTPGTAWSHQATDGGAYFDTDTNAWHYLFQCLGDDPTWNLCHASRKNADPLGAWTLDTAVSVHGGDIFKKMNHPEIHDEGTPQILEKVGSKFYVTFHGYDGTHGYRAIAWTTDFRNWSVDTNTPIFGPANCTDWNVSWAGGCIGSGEARTLHDDEYYYTVIEAADGNLACQRNQNWVFGIERTNNLTTPSWGAPYRGAGIIFNTSQLYPNGTGVECGVQYADLFKDDGTTYLSVWRTGVANGSTDTDPASGWYLYKLQRGAPVASYSFLSGGPQNKYVQSDIVSRGNLEARLDNISWLNPGVQMNGTSSVMTLPDNPVLKRSAPWSLEVNLTLSVSPITDVKSQFIGGDLASAWLEVYSGNTLCAWAKTSSGYKKACTTPTEPLAWGSAHTVALVVDTANLTLIVDGVRVATTPITSVPVLNRITIGSAGVNSANYYGAWKGILSKVTFYDRAL